MTNPLTALAERVEGLTGPDREVDALIAVAIGWTNVTKAGRGYVGHEQPGNYYGAVPAYTASLDAAVTLVPEGMMRARSGEVG